MSQTITVTLPKYHPGQKRIAQEAKRFNMVCCGRRFGKTKAGIRLLAEPALKGQPVAWFAPTNKMMTEVWREALRRLRPVIISRNTSERRLELLGGGVIEFWSLENYDSIRGRKYARVIIDEAAMVKKLGEIWQAVIRPTLTDLKGDAYMLSTPKGRNFFWECFCRGEDPLQPEWMSWQMPTKTNPYIDPLEVDAAATELPERTYQQEYGAVFLEDAGGVFRKVRQCAIAIPLGEGEPIPLGDYVMGVDWGQQNDFTVLSVFDTHCKRMVALERFNKIDWSFQRGRLDALARRWQVRLIVAEQNSIGGPNIEELQKTGLPVIGFDTNGSTKGPLIQSLALAFEQQDIEIFNDPVLISELESYEGTRSKETMRWKYSAPEGMHDDTVISCALGYYAIGVTPEVAPNPFYADTAVQTQPVNEHVFGVW